ncbi:capsule-associated protein CAP1 [Tulasnella sp. 330]|nr:capsule-associated protein CAP1 [Tulasnella sp. 330]KAG8877872.1 capsule-associated protein CAP1 [Tulasnella sp. 331]
MGNGTFSLANPRNRLILILTTFFALAFLILSPRTADRDGYSGPSRFMWSKSPVGSLFGWAIKPAVEEVLHPIPQLMHDAQAKYRAKIMRQSKTLQAAVKEYRARYKRDPPKGFDDWFQFAQENKVKIIDEYNGLNDDLEPFWGMSGEELRRRALQIGSLPSVDLVRLRNGATVTVNLAKGFEDSEVSARAKGFRVMMEKFQKKLPDMDFPINAKAEGRILVPWEHRNYPNTTKQDSSEGVEDMLGGPFVADWRGDGSVWDAYRKTCPPTSQARRLFGALRPNSNTLKRPVNRLEEASGGLPTRPDEDYSFAPSVDDEFNFCAHPWARYNQGHFFSDWRTIPVLYPIFSPAKGHGFSDIMIPSHYYYSSTKRYTYGWDSVNMLLSDDDPNEQPWDKKSDKIFWRGATTGGGSSPPGFLSQYQRHRFIKMTSDSSDANRTVVFPYPPGTPDYTFTKVPVAKLNEEIMDTAFTKAVGCTQYPGGCDGMRKDHRFADAVPLGEHWKYKYLIDFDGMGYSARLFAFLMSESAVIKSTVYKEFFSDWIQPWLHYIPLSSGYSEIYNIHAFFSGATPSMIEAIQSSNTTTNPDIKIVTDEYHDGDAQLRKIARAGRKWKMTIGRKVDMEAYVYRLCLEYARLWSDDRDAMTYKA